MIEYLYKEGEEPCERRPLKVAIDGRMTGEIRKVRGGYQYFHQGRGAGGDVLGTVVAVQRSLN